MSKISDLPRLLPSDYSGASDFLSEASKITSAAQLRPNFRWKWSAWLNSARLAIAALIPIAATSTLVATTPGPTHATGTDVTATLLNGSSVAVSGYPVAFTLSGAAAATSKLTVQSGKTNSAGVLVTHVSGTAAGAVVVTATYNSNAGLTTQTVTVTFT